MVNQGEEMDLIKSLAGLSRTGEALQTRGNHVQLFFDGDEAFDAMREAIASAERYVHLEMYMFCSDVTGNLFVEALAERAAAGIPVRVVVDGIGSMETDDEFFHSLRQTGAKVEVFRPMAPWRKRSGILGRNHRKSLIVDGRVAFNGGMNFGDEWSARVKGTAAWRDTQLKVEGPAAAACDRFFWETWSKVGGERPEVDGVYVLDGEGPGTSDCLVVGGAGLGTRKAIRHLYSTCLMQCQSDVVLTVPYLVPPERLLRRLRLAGRDGRVRLLVPQKSDVAIADWVREGLYPSLLASGVKIDEFTNGVLHAKTMAVDQKYGVVGSANFDLFSLWMNWELAVVIDDVEVAQRLNTQYEKDLTVSEGVTADWRQRSPWWRRALGRLGAVILRSL